MDIDRGLLSAICREGIQGFYDEGLRADMFEDAGRIGVDFVENYWREYSKVPDPQTIHKETGVDILVGPAEPIKFWAKEIKKRHLFNLLRSELGDVMDKMEARDPDAALSVLDKVIVKAREQAPLILKPKSIFADPERILEAYEQAKLGISGVATPWPSLNNMTRGWQPSDLAIFAARPGSGKTFLLLLLAKWAWESGKKVMIMSTEMSDISMMNRATAFTSKISYGRLKHGNLTSVEEAILKEKLDALKNDKNFLLYDGGFGLTTENIEMAVLDEKPDLVCIDAAYLLRSNQVKSRNRQERIAEIIDLIKASAKRTKVPYLITTQMNRPSKDGDGKEAGLDRLAFSDNMGMVADYVFFLSQTKEQKENKELELTPIKVRESEYSNSILINWKFDEQDFSEKNVSQASGAISNEKDGAFSNEQRVREAAKAFEFPGDDPF